MSSNFSINNIAAPVKLILTYFNLMYSFAAKHVKSSEHQWRAAWAWQVRRQNGLSKYKYQFLSFVEAGITQEDTSSQQWVQCHACQWAQWRDSPFKMEPKQKNSGHRRKWRQLGRSLGSNSTMLRQSWTYQAVEARQLDERQRSSNSKSWWKQLHLVDPMEQLRRQARNQCLWQHSESVEPRG